MAAFLHVENLVKSFGANTVVKGVNFAFNKGEFISLLGPSGCGKTTILRMIAGFERPTSGTIRVDGEDITNLKPNQRKLGMVFQAYALFPNLTVGDNIAFGLKIAGMPADQRRVRVEEMLKLIGLPGFEKRYPYEMSGGQQQRVALARAIAPKPRLLLLDEPLSALDAKIRVSLREEIRAIQQDLGITTVFVTHDQEEAMSISDRIVVMNAGNIDQLGAPRDIYNRPATKFVAGFVGTLNQFEGQVQADGSVGLAGQSVRVANLPSTVKPGDTIALAVRPETVSLVNGHDREVMLTGRVASVSFLGSVIRMSVDVGGTLINLDSFNDRQHLPPAQGSEVRIGFSADDVIALAN